MPKHEVIFLENAFVPTYTWVMFGQMKIRKMQECGITIAHSPAEIGKTLLHKLSN